MADKSKNIEKLKMMTEECRASHPHLFKATKIKDNDKPRFSIELLADKKTTKISEYQARVKEAIIQKWGSVEDAPKPLKLPYRDGDKPHGKKKEIKKEHVGMWVVRASTLEEYGRPHVVGKNPKNHLTSESELYPGCYVRAFLKANAYEVGENQGVSFILDGVQFIRDGEAFGGKKPADQMFGIVEGDDGDEAFDVGGDDSESFDEATF